MITWAKKVNSNEKLIMDVKNEVDVIRHSLTNILTELKKLNGKTIVDPLQVKRSKGQTMITVEVRLWNPVLPCKVGCVFSMVILA